MGVYIGDAAWGASNNTYPDIVLFSEATRNMLVVGPAFQFRTDLQNRNKYCNEVLLGAGLKKKTKNNA